MKVEMIEIERFEVTYDWTGDADEDPCEPDDLTVKADSIETALEMIVEFLEGEEHITKYCITGAIQVSNYFFLQEVDKN